MVKVAAVLVKETTPPDVLVALKVVTVLAPFKVVPPTEVVVKTVPLIGADCVIVLPEFKVTVLGVVMPLTVPISSVKLATTKALVLLTDKAPATLAATLLKTLS